MWQRLCRECRARSQDLNSDRGSASTCCVPGVTPFNLWLWSFLSVWQGFGLDNVRNLLQLLDCGVVCIALEGTANITVVQRVNREELITAWAQLPALIILEFGSWGLYVQ